MKRIAIIGGGISGLTCAYELELARKCGAPIDWHLYEASDRLGGIIETSRIPTPEGEFILEGGPDGWVTEKPWARELAIELGLESELIHSNDATRKTYILINGALQPVPDRMRMMAPEDLAALDASPLFSESAKEAYADELKRAEELKTSAPTQDESVADFVKRHFGDEVLNTLAAPLLSGVFGGDVQKLSVRAVVPQFAAMEREYGSLTAALQARKQQRASAPQPIFTSLRRGMGSVVEALIAALPSDRIHLSQRAYEVDLDVEEWYVDFMAPEHRTMWRRLTTVIPYWDDLILATPLDEIRRLLNQLDAYGSPLIRSDDSFLALTPSEASSAILVAFGWSAEIAKTFTIPAGFGLLVPERSSEAEHLLACTFVDQKFPNRAPDGARVMRAFFGGRSAEGLPGLSDGAIAIRALEQLSRILGPVPEPQFHSVHRWPRSLPQYEVGHLERIAKLETLVKQIPGLHLLGNSYHGVGIPDLIRDARATARRIIAQL